jgi:ABC-2 type transport system ATP-binding protein
MDALRTHDLCKSYGRHEVLHTVNLRVPAGCLYGFLGPNGAGKTTMIRTLLGLLRASAGRAEILGRDAWRDGPAVRAQVGYLPGEVRLYDHLTGHATLAFMDAARGGGAAKEVMRLADRFDLDLGKRVRNYSRGMKQKLGLIQALMHRPELLILDEPTIALDPLVRHTLFEELRSVAGEGRTVFFSSHTLGEVEKLCDVVAILREGRMIAQERIEVLRARAVRHVEVVFAVGAPAAGALPRDLHVLQDSENHLVATWTGPIEALVSWLARQPVRDLTIAPPQLEDLFMTYYQAGKPEPRP